MRTARVVATALAALAGSCGSLAAQVPAEPVLEGRVLLADTTLSGGAVVLHHVSADAQGEIDSTSVAGDGSFSFRLPRVPDPRREDMYFASVRHHGVLYFGSPVTLPVQLDSVYEIQAFDTAYVAAEGADVRVQVRYLFFEELEGRWRVTDLFQVLNETDRTFVAAEGQAVWSYPVASEAVERTVGPSDVPAGAATFQDGRFAVLTAIPPGERVYVIRYVLPELFVDVPVPEPVEQLEVLVREPSPPVEVPGLSPMGATEVEAGSTYLRFVGEGVGGEPLRIVRGEEVRPPSVEWMAVIVGLLLAGTAAFVLMRSGPTRAEPAAPAVPADRDAVRTLLVEIARLDEAFEAVGDPGAEREAEYRRKRAALLRRLGDVGGDG